MKQILALVFLLLFWSNVNSQVTIGSKVAPLEGVLLDLKEFESDTNNATATKGLGLPRIALSSANTLAPIQIEATESPDSYAGLVVYNIDKCSLNGSGIYVWNSANWDLATSDKTTLMSPGSENLEINSGSDARGNNTQISLTNSYKGNITWTITNTTPLGSINLETPSTTTGIYNNNLIVKATPMTIYNTNNPWQSLGTTIYLEDECGTKRDIILNQTNYALKANDQFEDSKIFLLNTQAKNFNVQSNLKWKLHVNDPTGLLNQAVLAGLEGINNTNGGTNTTSIPLNLSGSSSLKRYDIAKLTFSDGENKSRIKDITVSIMNCFGDIDTSQMGPNVKVNTDQDGNTFYSSLFGAAGEWMVTNLAATSFDPIRTSSDNVINAAMSATPYIQFSSYATPNWAYPSETSSNGTSNSDYLKNTHIGLLYNWSAASNSKGKGISTDRPSLGDGSAGVDEGDTNHPRIQGICPNGWHLPSDKEWTELENVFLENPSEYSTLSSIPHTSLDAYHNGVYSNPMDIKFGERVDEQGNVYALGTAMKDPCEMNTILYGQSKPALLGGFAALRVGLAVVEPGSEFTSAWGERGYFWSSSSGAYRPSHVQATAYMRLFMPTSEAILRFAYDRNNYVSVRCKKD